MDYDLDYIDLTGKNSVALNNPFGPKALPMIDNQGKKAALVLGLAPSAITLALPSRSTGFQVIATYLFLLGTAAGSS